MLFDRKRLALHRSRLKKFGIDCKFYDYAINDILERLQFIDLDYSNILDLGGRLGKLSFLLKKKYPQAEINLTEISPVLINSISGINKILVDEEELMLTEKFDLVCHCLGMQWINDIKSFLFRINQHLTPNGIFIGNFIGGDSFRNLKTKFIHIEDQVTKKHYARFAPFILFEHVGQLFHAAGFKEMIIDQEKIILEYQSPLTLMRELNKFGESSKLNYVANYSITKEMHALFAKNDILIEEIYLISFIACKNKGAIKIKY